MKALLGCMNPRRLQYFIKSVRAIDYIDVVLAKNYPLLDAEKQIIDFFLKNNYDILVFTSDDTEIPYDAPRQIVTDIVKTGHEIITGWSRCRPTKREANISLKPIRNIDRLLDRPVWYHQYQFLTVAEIESMLSRGETIIPIWFVGYSLTGMRRNVVEQWTPRGWFFRRTEPYHYVHNGVKGCWCSSDLWYSYQMWKLGYQKYADLRVYVPHDLAIGNRRETERAKELLVGKEPPEIEFIPAQKPL